MVKKSQDRTPLQLGAQNLNFFRDLQVSLQTAPPLLCSRINNDGVKLNAKKKKNSVKKEMHQDLERFV